VRVFLAILEHLVLCLLLLLQVFLHRLLLFLLGLSLGATLGVDGVIRLCSSRNGKAKATEYQAEKDRHSFHKVLSKREIASPILPQSRSDLVGSSVTEVTVILGWLASCSW